MRIVIPIVASALVLILILAGYLLYVPKGQDFALSRLSAIAMSADQDSDPDALSVFVCGSSSPLPDIKRAQACIAVLTPHHFYIVDAGAGSGANLLSGNLPLARLNGVLLTHFHSDHITAIPDINLNSWVAGRPEPLAIYGPTGVDRVVEGMNMAFELDRGYRVAHHGETLMPPVLGVLTHRQIAPGVIEAHNDLTITAFIASHKPVEPALGYRFDYKGRSVVVTGDTIINRSLEDAVKGIDLLLSDAISLPIVQALETAARRQGRIRNAKILADIQDYHAPVDDVIGLGHRAAVGMTALYHLVPPPRNLLMENIFKRSLPDNAILTKDRMWFYLPVNSRDILIR